MKPQENKINKVISEIAANYGYESETDYTMLCGACKDMYKWTKEQMIKKACKTFCNSLCGFRTDCRERHWYKDCLDKETLKKAMEENK